MAEFDEKIYDDIDRYLQGHMAPAERTQFDQLIAGDPLLKDEVKFQRTLINAVKHARRQELKNYIRANAGATSSGAGAGTRLLKLAAAILLVGGAGFFLYTLTQKENKNVQTAAVKQQEENSYSPPPSLESDTVNSTAGNLADNSYKDKTQPPTYEPRKETERKKQSASLANSESKVATDDNIAANESANGTLARPEPSVAPVSQHVFVKVIDEDGESETDSIKKAADIPQRRSVNIDFHPEAEQTGYRFYLANLELYGVEKTKAELLQYNDTMYLKLDRDFYKLSERIMTATPGTGVAPLSPLVKVQDKKLLRRLRQW
jgi:hypothetical protein